MTLSTNKELALSDLFPEYQVSSGLFHGAKEADEKHIREFGMHLKRAFERRLERMQNCVRDKGENFTNSKLLSTFNEKRK